MGIDTRISRIRSPEDVVKEDFKVMRYFWDTLKVYTFLLDFFAHKITRSIYSYVCVDLQQVLPLLTQ